MIRLLVGILLLAFFASLALPVGVLALEAGPAPTTLSSPEGSHQEQDTLIDCFPNFFKGECFAYGLAWFSQIFVQLMVWAVLFFGSLFSLALGVTIDGAFLDNEVIRDSWIIVRDFANVFFIFIVITIAIATMLRIESYNARKLLIYVVIAALLMNFSLALAKVIPDAGNVLALTFYNNIDAPTSSTYASFLGTKKDIGGAIANALNPQSLFQSDDSVSVLRGRSTLENLQTVLIANVATIILLGILCYVFVTGIIIFVSRIVILWMLFILAPLAVVAAVIPDLKSYWNDWRKRLIQQSVIAPVYLFFIYLVVRIAQSNFLQNAFEVSRHNATAGPVLGSLETWAASNARFILFYIILAGFLLASVRAAKTLGAWGAEWGEKFGGLLKNAGMAAATGGTSLLARAAIYPVRKPAQLGGAALQRRMVSRAKSKYEDLKDDDKAKKSVIGSNRVTRGIAMRGINRYLETRRDDIAEREKYYSSMKSADQIKLAAVKPFATKEDRIAAMKVLAEKFKDLKPLGIFNQSMMETIAKDMEASAVNTKAVKALNPTAFGTKIQDETKRNNEILKTVREAANPDNIRQWRKEDFKGNYKQHLVRGILESGNIGALAATMRHSEEARMAMEEEFERIAEEGDKSIKSKLDRVDNRLNQKRDEEHPLAGGYDAGRISIEIVSSPSLKFIRDKIELNYGKKEPKDKGVEKRKQDDSPGKKAPTTDKNDMNNPNNWP